MAITVGTDTRGCCAGCHRQVIEEKVVDGEVIVRLMSCYDEVQFTLNDDSKMRVAVCKDCKKELTDKHSPTLMKTIYNGWKAEVDKLVKDGKWDEKKKKDYLKRYKKKSILFRSEGMGDHDIENKIKQLKKKKEKSNERSL